MNTPLGTEMYALMKRLFPLCRSITGNGLRETLRILRDYIPLTIQEVPTGTKVFDWTVPREWNIRDAYVLDGEGTKVIDFKKNNLHVVGYSIPVHTTMTRAELERHLYSLPDQPEAIPFITSYYEERWGLCLAHRDRVTLKEGTYTVVIDSELKRGSLSYGELILPGATKEEVFLSTYVCHPSMANNELSGPVVTTFLAQMLARERRRYTYRIVFVPETIGSLTYLSRQYAAMKKRVVAGFNISCVGDNRTYSYLPSRAGTTLADKVALCILNTYYSGYRRYSFLDRGSDERQYNAPGIDLPVCCLMRSKYGTYPEYHTSLDDLSLVSPEGLAGGYECIAACLKLLEENRYYTATCLGEPQLSTRGLYPTLSEHASKPSAKIMIDFLAYADGTNDLIDISERINVPVGDLYAVVQQLLAAGLIR